MACKSTWWRSRWRDRRRLGRRYVDHWLETRHVTAIEKLRADNATTLERLGSDLRIEELRYAKLHEQRGIVLETIYKYLIETETAFQDVMNPVQEVGGSIPPVEQRAKDAADKANEFNEYFSKHRIYLDSGLCGQIDAFLVTARDAWFDYVMSREIPKDTAEDKKESRDYLFKAWQGAKDKLPEIRTGIEALFRGLLGVGDDGE